MTWILSYVAANFALIAVVALAVAGCCLIFWITKNLWAVVTAAVILIAGFGYMQADKSAFARAQAEQAAQRVAVLQGRLDTLSEVNQADATRSLADAEEIANLQLKAMQTPANDSPCMDEDAARRVGDVK